MVKCCGDVLLHIKISAILLFTFFEEKLRNYQTLNVLFKNWRKSWDQWFATMPLGQAFTPILWKTLPCGFVDASGVFKYRLLTAKKTVNHLFNGNSRLCFQGSRTETLLIANSSKVLGTQGRLATSGVEHTGLRKSFVLKKKNDMNQRFFCFEQNKWKCLIHFCKESQVNCRWATWKLITTRTNTLTNSNENLEKSVLVDLAGPVEMPKKLAPLGCISII